MDHSLPVSAGPLYPFEGRRPVVHPTAFVAPTAAVIGDVEIGEGANVWYHCVLRGDTNTIRIGPRSNIQDGTIVHVNAGRQNTVVGADVTVGHAAIVHACTLEDRAFVGMGATVLDGAVIEEDFRLSLPTGTVSAEEYQGFVDRVQAIDSGFMAGIRVEKKP